MLVLDAVHLPHGHAVRAPVDLVAGRVLQAALARVVHQLRLALEELEAELAEVELRQRGTWGEARGWDRRG